MPDVTVTTNMGLCPKSLKAKLYRFLTPARLVRIVAQPIYEVLIGLAAQGQLLQNDDTHRIGDVHMSLIHTCELNQVHPFDYLMALQQHVAAVPKAPQSWLPWNYEQAIAAAGCG
jgi:hypothetical protein